jgi:ribonuclease BN (tRNA processing enzyme)
MLRVIFLGSNGWYDSTTGYTTSILIESSLNNIVLDAGSGFNNIDSYIDYSRPTYLLISHLHFDHIIGLYSIAKLKIQNRVLIIGGKNIVRNLKKVFNQPFSAPFESAPFDVEIAEYHSILSQLPFELEVLPLLHSSPTLGFRLTLEGKTIAYCSDTGICDNVYKLAQNADLLITECSYKSEEYHINWPHLNPELAAHIAIKSKAKKMVLMHFDADRYRSYEDRERACEICKRHFSNTIISKDGLIIEM